METRSIFDKARIVVSKNMSDVYITMLFEALYKKNRITYTHSVNVGYMTAQICICNNLEKKIAQQVVRGALLHDIGKLFVPTEILEKEGVLTDDEYELVRKHTSDGVKILTNVTPDLATDIVLDIVDNHHEKPDGTGYYGKTNLSFYSQLIHAIDVYDAITSDRTYKNSYSSNYGLYILKEEGVNSCILDYITSCKVR